MDENVELKNDEFPQGGHTLEVVYEYRSLLTLNEFSDWLTAAQSLYSESTYAGGLPFEQTLFLKSIEKGSISLHLVEIAQHAAPFGILESLGKFEGWVALIELVLDSLGERRSKAEVLYHLINNYKFLRSLKSFLLPVAKDPNASLTLKDLPKLGSENEKLTESFGELKISHEVALEKLESIEELLSMLSLQADEEKDETHEERHIVIWDGMKDRHGHPLALYGGKLGAEIRISFKNIGMEQQITSFAERWGVELEQIAIVLRGEIIEMDGEPAVIVVSKFDEANSFVYE